MYNLLFCTFSLFSFVFSLAIVTSKNPVYSILSLIIVFFNVSGLFILLGAEFLALLFIVVYVGAVTVLFLFIIMMLNIKLMNIRFSVYRYVPIFIIFGFTFFLEFYLIFVDYLIPIDIYNLFLLNSRNCCLSTNPLNDWSLISFAFSNIIIFSDFIYTSYFFLFMSSSIVLLISMIGAISLTLHRRNDVKRQCIYKQINRNFHNSVSWKT